MPNYFHHEQRKLKLLPFVSSEPLYDSPPNEDLVSPEALLSVQLMIAEHELQLAEVEREFYEVAASLDTDEHDLMSEITELHHLMKHQAIMFETKLCKMQTSLTSPSEERIGSVIQACLFRRLQ